MKITIDDSATTSTLEEICRQIGAHVDEAFVPIHVDYPPINEVLAGKAVDEVFHPSGLLIREGRPVFVYIRDHTVKIFPDDIEDPGNLKKVHFSICQTLTEMKRQNRYESRYHVTNRTDNLYYVDIGGIGYNRVEMEVALYPCRFCLEEVGYNCYTRKMHKNQKQRIVESFDAKKAYDLLKQHFDAFRGHARGLRPDTAPTGYAPNQRELSRRYRSSKNYVCECCGAKGSARTTDMHHKDGNKRNNSADNLQCLCKPCHRNMHSHMR